MYPGGVKLVAADWTVVDSCDLQVLLSVLMATASVLSATIPTDRTTDLEEQVILPTARGKYHELTNFAVPSKPTATLAAICKKSDASGLAYRGSCVPLSS